MKSYSAECPNCNEWYYIFSNSSRERINGVCPNCGTELTYIEEWVRPESLKKENTK